MMEHLSTGAFLALGAGLCFAAGMFLPKRQAGRLSNVDFEGFVQNINEGYYRSSLEGKQLFGNRALVRLNGYKTEEEFIASVCDIATEWYVEPDRRNQFKRLLEDNGYVENFVSEIYRHKTRERIWISENARLVYDKAGRPMYYEGTIREHTETMKRLKMQELHTRLADQIPGVLFQARQVEGKAFEIPYFSRGFEAMLGLRPSAIEKDASIATDVIHHDDVEDLAIAAHDAAVDMQPLNHKFRICPGNGSEVRIEVNATPMRESDNMILWHGVLLEVTDENSVQSQTRRSPKCDSGFLSQTGSIPIAPARYG